MESSLELEKILADDEQNINASAIRQTVPTNGSSTANRQQPAKNSLSAE